MPAELTRIEGWQEALAQFYTDWQGKDFTWGTTDCFCFTAAGVQAITGTDLISTMRGSYSSLAAGRRILRNGARLDGKRVRFGNSAGFWRHFLGEEAPVLSAGRGDVVLFTEANGPYRAISAEGQPLDYAVRNDLDIHGVVGDDGRTVWVRCEVHKVVSFRLEDGAMAWRV